MSKLFTLTILAVVFSQAAVNADFTWEKTAPPGPSVSGGFCLSYDLLRDKIVFYAGYLGSYLKYETWEWSEDEWEYIKTQIQPGFPWHPGMAYDDEKQRMVLFGGFNPETFEPTDETWEWDGVSWTQIFPNISPPARVYPAMVYDKVRKRIILYGGETSWLDHSKKTLLTDTWEWDGTNWTECMVSKDPGTIGPMVYHEQLGKSVMVALVTFDIWAWDGIDWEFIPTEHFPPSRLYCDIEYDITNENIVLFGGDDYSDTWIFDGTDWLEVFPEYPMEPRRYHKMVYDHALQRVVLFGGFESSTKRLGDMFAWDGTDWTPVIYPDRPQALSYPSMAGGIPDMGVIQFGGSIAVENKSDETWEFRNGEWFQHFPDTHPSAREMSMMAGDYDRGVIVLYGGETDSGDKDDTWEWDGTSWTEKFPANEPPARLGSGFAYDSARQEVVMFGGTFAASFTDETWTWDGGEWHLKTPVNKPPPRWKCAMACDANRERIVMFGGWSQEGMVKTLHPNTWEWDGENWEEIIVTPDPYSEEERDLDMFYYAPLEVIVLHAVGYFDPGLWTWDGSVWTQIEPDFKIDQTDNRAGAYYPEEEQIVLFGGQCGGNRNDTWVGYFYDPTPTPTSPATLTPTVTPTPSNTPTMDATSTPEPPTDTPVCSITGATLWMPSHDYYPGDPCACQVTVCNMGGEPLDGYPLFVILDVYGTYYFAPEFTEDFDNYLDQYPGFPPGETQVMVLEQFAWPDNAGDASNIFFHAALTDPGMTGIFGDWDSWEFGWN